MDAPAEISLRQPIALPKLTFLCGPPNHGQFDLASALCSRDGELGPFDFMEPVRLATASLFFNGNFMSNDLTDPTVYDKLIPEASYQLTYLDWMDQAADHLRMCSPGILGRIALKNMTEDGEIDNVFARILFRDCHNLADARVFIDKFNPIHCLLVHCGPLTDSAAKGIEGIKSIWLPEPGVEARMKLLEHELNLLPNTTEKDRKDWKTSQERAKDAGL